MIYQKETRNINMNKFMYKMANFFSGRYGVDNVFYGFCVLSVVLAAVNIFTRSWILQLIIYALFIIAIVRAMSRNIEKRSAESRKFSTFTSKFSGVFSKIKSKFNLAKRMFKDRKTHCYVKCSECKKVLRLPKKKGLHTVKCPNCSNTFQVKI